MKQQKGRTHLCGRRRGRQDSSSATMHSAASQQRAPHGAARATAAWRRGRGACMPRRMLIILLAGAGRRVAPPLSRRTGACFFLLHRHWLIVGDSSAPPRRPPRPHACLPPPADERRGVAMCPPLLIHPTSARPPCFARRLPSGAGCALPAAVTPYGARAAWRFSEVLATASSLRACAAGCAPSRRLLCLRLALLRPAPLRSRPWVGWFPRSSPGPPPPAARYYFLLIRTTHAAPTGTAGGRRLTQAAWPCWPIAAMMTDSTRRWTARRSPLFPAAAAPRSRSTSASLCSRAGGSEGRRARKMMHESVRPGGASRIATH